MRAAPVLAEVARSIARRSAFDRVLRSIPVVDTDRTVVTRAGALLGDRGLDSRHAVDAFVAVTAIGARASTVLTGDPDDLVRLLDDEPGVAVHGLP